MRINIGDTTLFFEVYGNKVNWQGENTHEKPTLIFLHGGAGFLNQAPYLTFWSRFADVAQVIFLDQRGSGLSPCQDKSTWNLKQWGQDVYQFCQALHIEKPIVAGISYGGMVAQSYAMQYPDHPAGIVMTDTDAHIDQDHMLTLVAEKCREKNYPVEQGVAITQQVLQGPLTPEVIERYFNDILTLFGDPVPAVLDDFSRCDPKLANVELGEDFLAGELLTMDYRDKLKDIPCPVLFLTGDQGPMHSLKTAQELIAAFPAETIESHVFEGAKAACYESDPERAEQLIRHFIQRVRTAS